MRSLPTEKKPLRSAERIGITVCGGQHQCRWCVRKCLKTGAEVPPENFGPQRGCLVGKQSRSRPAIGRITSPPWVTERMSPSPI